MSNEYYEPCVKNYREVDNDAAVKEWFESTEPRDGIPNHTRCLHVLVAEAIMTRFLSDIELRLAFAAEWAYDPLRETLQGRNNRIQAIAEKPLTN